MKKVVFGLLATAVFGLWSCGSKDLYDATAAEQEAKASYTANFSKKYSDVNLNQSWDYTRGARLGTRAAGEVTATLVDGLNFGISNNAITENKSIYDAIKTVLPEKKAQQGNPAVLVTPASSFYIFPVSTQGRWTYDLMIRVGDNEPVKLYSKTWVDYSKPYVNGMTSGGAVIDMKGLYVSAPVGTPVDIYIDNVNSNTTGPKPSVGTSSGQAIYVDVPEDVTLDVPEEIDLRDDAIIKYVGIEDCTVTSGSEMTDNDYNDIVLAIVGNPDVPAEAIITEDSYEVNTNVTKRYLIEDLGSTDDFDFNDVVVDVVANTVTTHKVTYKNGILDSDEVSSEETTARAIIRAMGGTLDFTLTIGNTTWTKSGAGFEIGKMYNTAAPIDYTAELATFDVEGWVPGLNNVEIQVLDKSKNVYNITFPKSGTVPMIIAVEPEQNWMTERTSVPSSWFY
ncbi:MAG: hypothetical protein IJ637_03245 [Prevotella sp.]|nr:hypothetical protein [Prevotella sp.]